MMNKMKYIDNSPKYGCIDFREHRELEIKFQQEFVNQLKGYPCFNIIERDCVGNNIFDVKSRFKGLVLKRVYAEYMENIYVEDDIPVVTSIFIRFMLRTMARGYDLQQSEYAESGYIKIPSTFKLSDYLEYDIDVENYRELVEFYNNLNRINIDVKLPDMVIEWEYDEMYQQYSIVYGFRTGLVVRDNKV